MLEVKDLLPIAVGTGFSMSLFWSPSEKVLQQGGGPPGGLWGPSQWARPAVLTVGGQHTGLGGWCGCQHWLGSCTRWGTHYRVSIIKMLSEECASSSQTLNTSGYTTWDITSACRDRGHRWGVIQMKQGMCMCGSAGGGKSMPVLSVP